MHFNSEVRKLYSEVISKGYSFFYCDDKYANFILKQENGYKFAYVNKKDLKITYL